MRTSLFFLISFFGLTTVPAYAQSAAFGQNKVQYEQFKWSFFQTEHFDVYFTQGGDRIARFAGLHLEKMYGEVSEAVGHKLSGRVPIILHNSHAQFVQTNVIRLPLHEGIGGFTEIFKNRVVLPFEGSYHQFYHVLQHELVHAVVFDMLYGENASSMVSRQAAYQFPLWVNEGLAEYASTGWDLASEFFMVDATTFGYVQSPVHDFGGFLAYKGGQLFFHFMESVYGKGTSTRFIQNLVVTRNTADAFQKTTKTSLEEAGEIWLRELRHIYWPELGRRQYGKSVARQLTRRDKDLSFYNLQPSISPDGKEIAYFSDRESWEGIFILNVESEKVTRSVIKGGDKGRHESFHSFKSGIAWSPDSKRLAIVSKSRGKNVIHIIDAKSGKIRDEIMPEVEGILSPAWSRDGRYIAFSGLQEGLTDIYVWDLQAKSLRRLTHDIAHDDKPAFSPSGNWIAFESDRGTADLADTTLRELDAYGRLSKYSDIYRINFAGDTLELVSGSGFDDKMPSYGPSDSLLVFVSNRSGIDNVYLSMDTVGGFWEKPLTNLLSGCFTPSFSWDGSLMAFSLFERGGWDIFLMTDPLEKTLPEELPKTHFMKTLEKGGEDFFRPLNWANLSSFKPDTADTSGKAKVDRSKPKRIDSLSLAATSTADSTDSTVSKDTADSTVVGEARATDSLVVAEVDTTSISGTDTVAVKSSGKKSSPFISDSSYYLTDAGDFVKRKYTPQFSLDMVSAGLGYDNFYGAGGLAFVTLSDLMGDQEISMALNINGGFDNASGVIHYEYLPLKPDFAVTVHHQAFNTRSLQVTDQTLFYGDTVYLDRQWGASTTVRYPFSIFSRLQMDIHALFRSRTEQERSGNSFQSKEGAVIQRLNSVLPKVSWVHDASLWGIVGPVNGHRVYGGLQTLLPIFQEDKGFALLEADFRKYWQFKKRYTLAWRVSAGLSEPLPGYENPHSFLVGGDEFNLFNPRPNIDNFPLTLEEFHYSDLDVPLRGFDYYDFRGDRKFISNLEFRFPFVREFSIVWPLPIAIRHVMGNLFVDYGGAWSRGNAFNEFGMGMGGGMRLNLGIFVLRWTRAWSVNIKGLVEKDNPTRDYWSLGAEF